MCGLGSRLAGPNPEFPLPVCDFSGLVSRLAEPKSAFFLWLLVPEFEAGALLEWTS